MAWSCWIQGILPVSVMVNCEQYSNSEWEWVGSVLWCTNVKLVVRTSTVVCMMFRLISSSRISSITIRPYLRCGIFIVIHQPFLSNVLYWASSEAHVLTCTDLASRTLNSYQCVLRASYHKSNIQTNKQKTDHMASIKAEFFSCKKR